MALGCQENALLCTLQKDRTTGWEADSADKSARCFQHESPSLEFQYSSKKSPQWCTCVILELGGEDRGSLAFADQEIS